MFEHNGEDIEACQDQAAGDICRYDQSMLTGCISSGGRGGRTTRRLTAALAGPQVCLMSDSSPDNVPLIVLLTNSKPTHNAVALY